MRVRNGAELVLSVNAGNRAAARDWGCEVVVLPDTPGTLSGLEDTVDQLTAWGVPFRLDPILEPIGFGFAASLGRYLEVRRRFPESAMLMGVGNLTELTEVDSAGVNALLLGICQEVGIRSVLTTAVINWARSFVLELDLARRLMYHAVTHLVLPKRLTSDLVLLRDPKLHAHGAAALAELAARIKDRNYRLFAEEGLIHVLSGSMHSSRGATPSSCSKRCGRREEIDPGHAFYLGYEMAKAVTALTLGKNYTQDQAQRHGVPLHPRSEPPLPRTGCVISRGGRTRSNGLTSQLAALDLLQFPCTQTGNRPHRPGRGSVPGCGPRQWPPSHPDRAGPRPPRPRRGSARGDRRCRGAHRPGAGCASARGSLSWLLVPPPVVRGEGGWIRSRVIAPVSSPETMGE